MNKKNRRIQLIVIIVIMLLLAVFSICLAVYAAGDAENKISETEALSFTVKEETAEIEEKKEYEKEGVKTVTHEQEIKSAGEYFTQSFISEEILERINGCSYVENDNISLEELRYLQVLYIGFDGEEHVGELIVNEEIANDVLDIFYELYKEKYPIERMVLVDEYGGDDEKSMQANNTSSFNYRTIEGSDKLSKHSYGMAIDINPFYNPCVRKYSDGASKSFPEGSDKYADRDNEFLHKIDKDDLCYKLFTEHGFKWGGDWKSLKDYQHFEKDMRTDAD